jgi:hypothetical protein
MTQLPRFGPAANGGMECPANDGQFRGCENAINELNRQNCLMKTKYSKQEAS